MPDPSDVMNSEEFRRDNAGFLTSDDVRIGLIRGVTFPTRPVQYAVVDGRAVFEGCIVLGSAEELQRQTAELAVAAARSPEEAVIAGAVVRTGARYRWPGALMSYAIDDSLPDQQRVREAIEHWEDVTALRFVERTTANESKYPNFVEVIPSDDGCWAEVGMQGDGRQELGLSDGCGRGQAIHEFGHAWGLWHEQSREDRDSFVTINWANIDPGREHNFNQHISDGDDVGAYDYGSIMHYGRFAFSVNGLPTIEPTQPGVTIGQRNGLSSRDLAAIRAIYGTLVNLGGDVAGAPAVAATGAGRLEVFFRGIHDNDLVQRTWNGSTWSGFKNLGGDLTSSPAVAFTAPNRLDVFIRGADNHLVQRTWNGSTWSGWNNLGGDAAGAPAVAATGAGRLEVFFRGIHDNDLVQRTWNGSTWSGFKNLGGDLTSSPAVAFGEGTLSVFARGGGNALMGKQGL